ncbi:MAG: hypothetical protein A2087_07000 [Spirochaetes bacterium GWD1_61_31]|nr:MAG: hypothetical protein A2Y37_08470 [Spirochaetes bacterium GWB1_60_80]OHD28477.1 MAG: hypothetical protein A2004_14785 [Spirochaetes bacterium GWC1_61_12]OHD40093.1 MAG: hypothetical protein A2087_07000 [Spirochaetes bacterium GWD1_61_31]OHD45859.1 MAG: hypothetical protein A2Y35_04105 [Spirochaetes bacterium GWE1_60_18]OHD58402.1 MAG: hypothetical protein A2Y32_06495 [Spirochaetes bacterium GWF1_60_12]HAW85382.1 ABC transporter ATP-binding protein [Spirochaetaceae bacterium]
MTIECQALTRRFPGGRCGLDGLDLRLDTAGFTLITGHNGSGKSLLLRHLLGLEQPDAGRVLVDGRPLAACLAGTRRRVALVFQEPEHQILGLTVAEDMAFGPSCAGRKPADYEPELRSALACCGLAGFEEHLTANLSGGEKRRLAVAACLASQPELLLLDEPFNDLDWRGASELLAILQALRADGIGIVVVTHDLEKCLAHADRLVVLDGGRVVRDAPPAELWAELPALGLRRLPGGLDQLPAMTWLKAEACVAG